MAQIRKLRRRNTTRQKLPRAQRERTEREEHVASHTRNTVPVDRAGRPHIKGAL